MRLIKFFKCLFNQHDYQIVLSFNHNIKKIQCKFCKKTAYIDISDSSICVQNNIDVVNDEMICEILGVDYDNVKNNSELLNKYKTPNELMNYLKQQEIKIEN